MFIVGVVVTGAASREEAELHLHGRLPLEDGATDPYVEEWWIAQDDRRDRSDRHSAVFVPYNPGARPWLPPPAF